LKITSPATWIPSASHYDADGILKRGAAEHVLAGKHVAATTRRVLADAKLRWQIDDVGFFKSRHGAQELGMPVLAWRRPSISPRVI
jgi:hypothetical protein